MGLTWEEVEASAQDRHSWRQRVALCIGDAGWIKVNNGIPWHVCTIVHVKNILRNEQKLALWSLFSAWDFGGLSG